MSDSSSFIRIPKPSSLTPLLLTLTGSLAIGAFSFAWQTSKDMALLKAQSSVSPVEFAKLQAQVSYLEEKGRETHAGQREELERLRTWMRAHRHGGAVPPPVEQPAPSSP